MESTVGERRLPSLDDLLESEVILGDDDESDLSDTSDLASSEKNYSPRTATEEPASERPPTPTPTPAATAATAATPTPASTATSAALRQLTAQLVGQLDRRADEIRSAAATPTPTPTPVKTPTPTPRASFTRTPTNLTSSKGRASLGGPTPTPTTPASGRNATPHTALGPRRSLSIVAPSSSSRRHGVAAPPSPAPSKTSPPSTARPKVSTLTRQPSNLKAPSSSSSPSSASSASLASPSPSSSSASRRASSVAPAARAFLNGGRQASTLSPRRDAADAAHRYATLGRKSKAGASGVFFADDPMTTSMLATSSSTSAAVTSPASAPPASKETKAAADKFATLPRRPKAKERPPLPPKLTPEAPTSVSTSTSMSASASSSSSSSTATLPRPKKSPAPATKPALPPKPKILLYMEKGAQTEMSQQDVRDGQEAAQRLRVLARQPPAGAEEVRQLERLLHQSRDECAVLRRQLDEEREERVLVQQELERTTQRVAAMLASMEGVEKEFHTRGDSLVQLEASLHNSTHTIFALQEQLEAQDAALLAQRLELDRSLVAQQSLAQQLHEAESEGREMVEFLQAEKLALAEAVRDADAEQTQLREQLKDGRQQLAAKEDECRHLVRLTEQRRHQLAALQAEMRGAEGRNGSALLAQGAQLSAASLALFRLSSRLDALLAELVSKYNCASLVAELEAADAATSDAATPDAEMSKNDAPAMTTETAEDVATAEAETLEAVDVLAEEVAEEVAEEEGEVPKAKAFLPLIGSASLQDLSDAINLSRRRPPEGREEPSRAADEELRLASSFVDQIDDADRRLHRLLRLVERLLRDKDLTVQLLADDKEQLVATVSALTTGLHEAKEELHKVRRHDDRQSLELGLQLQQLQTQLDAAYEDVARLKKTSEVSANKQPTYYAKQRPRSWRAADVNDDDDDVLIDDDVIDDVIVVETQDDELTLRLIANVNGDRDPNANGTG